MTRSANPLLIEIILVLWDYRNSSAYVGSAGARILWENNVIFPDLLTTVTNGLGTTTSITYKPLTNSTVYIKDYVYKAPGEHGDFDLLSLGKDGQPGGSEEAADIVNWQ